jgi:hypothetical protein
MFREAARRALDRVRSSPQTEPNEERVSPSRLHTSSSPRSLENGRERFFCEALVHLLGYPDNTEGPDAVYRNIKLVFTCDELYYGDEHNNRTRAVNEAYTQRGYYVVRVMAFDPLDTYNRTLRAVRLVLEERRRNYAKNDFGGKILVVDDERYGRKHIDSIERAGPALTALGRACMRGLIWAQELAMARAERRQESTVPSTAAVGASISTTIRSKHEQYWGALLDSYDAEHVYAERMVRIERDLKLRSS